MKCTVASVQSAVFASQLHVNNIRTSAYKSLKLGVVECSRQVTHESCTCVYHVGQLHNTPEVVF